MAADGMTKKAKTKKAKALLNPEPIDVMTELFKACEKDITKAMDKMMLETLIDAAKKANDTKRN